MHNLCYSERREVNQYKEQLNLHYRAKAYIHFATHIFQIPSSTVWIRTALYVCLLQMQETEVHPLFHINQFLQALYLYSMNSELVVPFTYLKNCHTGYLKLSKAAGNIYILNTTSPRIYKNIKTYLTLRVYPLVLGRCLPQKRQIELQASPVSWCSPGAGSKPHVERVPSGILSTRLLHCFALPS